MTPARSKLLAVLALLLGGVVSIISTTQPWITLTLTEGSNEPLDVAGGDAIALLAPLSLAAMALGLALTIVGRGLRHVLGAIGVAIGVGLLVTAVPVMVAPPQSTYSNAVSDRTGLSGSDAISALVSSATPTIWPAIGVVGAVLILAAGIWTLATAHTWARGGRRYAASEDAAPQLSRPRDAIDSWDDLSRGADPTR